MEYFNQTFNGWLDFLEFRALISTFNMLWAFVIALLVVHIWRRFRNWRNLKNGRFSYVVVQTHEIHHQAEGNPHVLTFTTRGVTSLKDIFHNPALERVVKTALNATTANKPLAVLKEFRTQLVPCITNTLSTMLQGTDANPGNYLVFLTQERGHDIRNKGVRIMLIQAEDLNRFLDQKAASEIAVERNDHAPRRRTLHHIANAVLSLGSLDPALHHGEVCVGTRKPRAAVVPPWD